MGRQIPEHTHECMSAAAPLTPKRKSQHQMDHSSAWRYEVLDYDDSDEVDNQRDGFEPFTVNISPVTDHRQRNYN